MSRRFSYKVGTRNSSLDMHMMMMMMMVMMIVMVMMMIVNMMATPLSSVTLTCFHLGEAKDNKEEEVKK